MLKRIAIASICLIGGLSCAAAQTGTIKTQSQLNSEISAFFPDQTAGQIIPLNTRQTLLDMVASSLSGAAGLPIADPRNFSTVSLVCSGGVNASTAIAAAITAGFTRIRLPAGCFYQPPTVSGSEVVPAGIQIIGDNDDPNLGNVSLVQTANRATGTDFLQLAARATLQNVAVQSNDCDQNRSPLGTQKVCPAGYITNIGDQTQSATPWPYQPFLFLTGTSTTQPGPIVSTDTPIIACLMSNTGDCVFLATLSTGVGLRVQTQGTPGGDTGIKVQDGIGLPANLHNGLQCAEYGTNAVSSCLLLERINGSSAPLAINKDDGTGTTTGDWNQWLVNFQSSGNIRNIQQGTTAFSGNFDLINAGNSGGTFTGNFSLYEVAGVAKYIVSSAGNVSAAGTLSLGSAGGTSGLISLTGTTSGTAQINANATGQLALTGINGQVFILNQGGSSGSLTLTGATSGSFTQSVSATGGHLAYTGGTAPTLTAGCTGAGSSVTGTDIAGTVVGSTAAATTCTLTFGTAFAAAPNCVVMPQNFASFATPFIAVATGSIQVTFASLANAKWSYVCYGA